EFLYKVLAVLQPLPIKSVAKEQANLTEIFLQIVKQGNNIND
ncbi:ABC transporter ATP-binding protein, partial [Chroococcidiopsis cubana CCALA 043]